jgi:hypothetical protein
LTRFAAVQQNPTLSRHCGHAAGPAGVRRAIEITRVKITEAGRRALFELQYCGPAAGMIDSLDEAKATFEGVGAA